MLLIAGEPFMTIVEEILLIPRSEIVDSLAYQSIPEWDSVAHMTLIAAFEEAYRIAIDVEDIEKMNSISNIKTVLMKYYRPENLRYCCNVRRGSLPGSADKAT